MVSRLQLVNGALQRVPQPARMVSQNLDGDTFYGVRVELLEEREADA